MSNKKRLAKSSMVLVYPSGQCVTIFLYCFSRIKKYSRRFIVMTIHYTSPGCDRMRCEEVFVLSIVFVVCVGIV